MDKEDEIKTFEEAWKNAHEAEQKIAVLSADLVRHVEALQSCNVARTSVMQANLSLEAIEAIVYELNKANRGLLRILLKSGE